MTTSLTYNPYLTSTAAGSFNTTSVGYIQGTALPDPALRNELAGGWLKSTETIPMWGGVGISETVGGASGGPSQTLGSIIARATTLTSKAAGELTGFSVFDQNHSMVNSPQSPVPMVGTYGQVNFYRLGSGIRLAVAAAPSLVSVQGGLITQNVSWDFGSQQLIPYSPAYAASVISNAVWASTSGGQVTFTTADDLTTYLNAGDYIEVTGIVNTGGASTSAFNGNWVVVSVTSSTVVVTATASATIGTYSSGGLLVAGGGALNVKVLDVQVGNSMTVTYDSVTGFATWNRSGTCVVIQL